MKFRVTVTDEMMARGDSARLVFLELRKAVLGPDDYVCKEYDLGHNGCVFTGQLTDTPEAEQAVRMLTALAKGHPLCEPSDS